MYIINEQPRLRLGHKLGPPKRAFFTMIDNYEPYSNSLL